MRIDLDDLVTCTKCGCVYDFTMKGSRKYYCGQEEIEGECPVCKEKYYD